MNKYNKKKFDHEVERLQCEIGQLASCVLPLEDGLVPSYATIIDAAFPLSSRIQGRLMALVHILEKEDDE